MINQTSITANTLSTAETGAALLPLLRRIGLGDLTASLLHDLNNPLTAILNYTQLLQMRQLAPEEIEEFVKNIMTEGERMAAMTARLRALTVAPDGRRAKLQEALGLAFDLLKTRFRHDGIEVEQSAGQNLPNTNLSLADLLQLILALLEQARHALNAHTTPAFEKRLRCFITSSENRRQRLTISHNGLSSPDAASNFLLALFPYPQQQEQIQVAAAMTQALLISCNCKIVVELLANGWTALHLDIPAEA